MNDEDFLWPLPGLRPFMPDGPDLHSNAWLPDRPTWLVYFEGYRRGLNVLVEHVLTNHRDHNFLVYPIAFLGRQTIEVGLKYVILLARELQGKQQEPFPGTHDLIKLWAIARPLLEALSSPPEEGDLDAVEEAIAALADHDSSSFTFRYPVDRRNDRPSFVTGDARTLSGDPNEMPNQVNLRGFREWVGRAANFLRAGMDLLSVDIETEAEERRYYEQLYGDA